MAYLSTAAYIVPIISTLLCLFATGMMRQFIIYAFGIPAFFKCQCCCKCCKGCSCQWLAICIRRICCNSIRSNDSNSSNINDDSNNNNSRNNDGNKNDKHKQRYLLPESKRDPINLKDVKFSEDPRILTLHSISFFGLWICTIIIFIHSWFKFISTMENRNDNNGDIFVKQFDNPNVVNPDLLSASIVYILSKIFAYLAIYVRIAAVFKNSIFTIEIDVNTIRNVLGYGCGLGLITMIAILILFILSTQTNFMHLRGYAIGSGIFYLVLDLLIPLGLAIAFIRALCQSKNSYLKNFAPFYSGSSSDNKKQKLLPSTTGRISMSQTPQIVPNQGGLKFETITLTEETPPPPTTATAKATVTAGQGQAVNTSSAPNPQQISGSANDSHPRSVGDDQSTPSEVSQQGALGSGNIAVAKDELKDQSKKQESAVVESTNELGDQRQQQQTVSPTPMNSNNNNNNNNSLLGGDSNPSYIHSNDNLALGNPNDDINTNLNVNIDARDDKAPKYVYRHKIRYRGSSENELGEQARTLYTHIEHLIDVGLVLFTWTTLSSLVFVILIVLRLDYQIHNDNDNDNPFYLIAQWIMLSIDSTVNLTCTMMHFTVFARERNFFCGPCIKFVRRVRDSCQCECQCCK